MAKNELWTQLVVMIYDVVEDRRRTRLRKLLKNYGLPVQKSAFEARLERSERKHLLDLVARIINPREDSFVIYPISKTVEDSVVAIGLPRPDIEVQTFFII